MGSSKIRCLINLNSYTVAHKNNINSHKITIKLLDRREKESERQGKK